MNADAGIAILVVAAGLALAIFWAARHMRKQEVAVAAQVKTEQFTLKEGPVTITYPAQISSASLGDLKQYLDIFQSKAQRPDDPHDPVPPQTGAAT